MQEKGFSQSSLSRATGIDRTLLNKILSGERRTNAEQLATIARALMVSIQALTPTEEEPLPPAPQAAPRDRKPPEAVSAPGSSVPSARRLPPGLEGFLERHGEDVTPAERSLLERSGFSTDKRVQFNDDFWWAILRVIRKYYLGPGGGGEAGGGAAPPGGH
jgi:transcriptional regulator with XRE-family HTH domain